MTLLQGAAAAYVSCIAGSIARAGDARKTIWSPSMCGGSRGSEK